MLIKIRSWIYFLFMISFAAFGFILTSVMQDKVILFAHLSIPSLTKYIIPLLTSSIIIVWGLWMLLRFGFAAEAEEMGDIAKAYSKLLKMLLESPTICMCIVLLNTIILDVLQKDLLSWEQAEAVYSYGVLWFATAPCVFSMLEFIQGITGFAHVSSEDNTFLKKHQTIDGFVSFAASIVHLYLLLTIANMTICKWSYLIFASLVMYRIFKLHHISATLWTNIDSLPPEQTHKEEGIL